MSVLYLYALAPAPPADRPGSVLPPLGAGLAGEPLRAVPVGGLLALVGKAAAPPALSAQTLAGQDATVRRLADLLPALLPVRFGEHAAGEADLAERLAPRAAELSAALERVAGCVQMTLRVFRTAASPPGTEAAGADPPSTPVSAAGGPGTRYLAARRQDLERARAVPEIAPLRDALAPLLRAERAERLERLSRGPSPPGPFDSNLNVGAELASARVEASSTPTQKTKTKTKSAPRPLAPFSRNAELLATVYHLIERGSVAAYSRALAEASSRLSGVRVAVSGPWPAYAFTPEGASREVRLAASAGGLR